MRWALRYVVPLVLAAVGLGLLYLSNGGYIPLGEPYVREASRELLPNDQPVAFVGVNVVQMDQERVLEDMTVVVRGGRISEVGERGAVAVPDGALVVWGAGQYLMPGLVDMHVHVEEEDDLLLYLANGVTAVRNMWGNTGLKRALGYPDQLALREEVEDGGLLGPRIYTTGPIMEGEPASTPMMPVIRAPGEARESVAWQAERGYDFVKVYDHLSPEVYRAILDAARERGLPVVGHAPKRVGLDGVLAGGQRSIEHLTGYLDPDAAELLVPEDELERYARNPREAGVYNCPTIGLYTKLVPEEEVEELERRTAGMRYVSPRTRATWRLFLPQMREDIAYRGPDYSGRIHELYTSTTRELHEGGAEIVAGTDATNPYLVPGFSLHDELGYLTEAGLSSYEAIEAATASAAEALGERDEFGTVAEGLKADLILTEENPLQDVSNLRDPAGVMANGRWLPRDQLLALLEGLAESHRPAVMERLWPLGLVAAGLILFLVGVRERSEAQRGKREGR